MHSHKPGVEIERRFLIALPDEAFLEGAQCSQITQTYLTAPEGTTERVRRRVYAERVVCTHTVKRRIGGIAREEREREISQQEYEALSLRADKQRRVIEKSRYCLEYKGQLLEIDIYPFWNDRAILEIELDDEEEAVFLPPELRVVKEISLDKRYTNSALALSVPEDEL